MENAKNYKNPKFTYQKEIADLFHRSEHRYKQKEKVIFNKMEDLLDDEEIRIKITDLEEKAQSVIPNAINKTLTEVLGP